MPAQLWGREAVVVSCGPVTIALGLHLVVAVSVQQGHAGQQRFKQPSPGVPLGLDCRADGSSNNEITNTSKRQCEKA